MTTRFEHDLLGNAPEVLTAPRRMD